MYHCRTMSEMGPVKSSEVGSEKTTQKEKDWSRNAEDERGNGEEKNTEFKLELSPEEWTVWIINFRVELVVIALNYFSGNFKRSVMISHVKRLSNDLNLKPMIVSNPRSVLIDNFFSGRGSIKRIFIAEPSSLIEQLFNTKRLDF